VGKNIATMIIIHVLKIPNARKQMRARILLKKITKAFSKALLRPFKSLLVIADNNSNAKDISGIITWDCLARRILPYIVDSYMMLQPISSRTAAVLMRR
jgi:hypothetical protein